MVKLVDVILKVQTLSNPIAGSYQCAYRESFQADSILGGLAIAWVTGSPVGDAWMVVHAPTGMPLFSFNLKFEAYQQRRSLLNFNPNWTEAFEFDGTDQAFKVQERYFTFLRSENFDHWTP